MSRREIIMEIIKHLSINKNFKLHIIIYGMQMEIQIYTFIHSLKLKND